MKIRRSCLRCSPRCTAARLINRKRHAALLRSKQSSNFHAKNNRNFRRNIFLAIRCNNDNDFRLFYRKLSVCVFQAESFPYPRFGGILFHRSGTVSVFHRIPPNRFNAPNRFRIPPNRFGIPPHYNGKRKPPRPFPHPMRQPCQIGQNHSALDAERGVSPFRFTPQLRKRNA